MKKRKIRTVRKMPARELWQSIVEHALSIASVVVGVSKERIQSKHRGLPCIYARMITFAIAVLDQKIPVSYASACLGRGHATGLNSIEKHILFLTLNQATFGHRQALCERARIYRKMWARAYPMIGAAEWPVSAIAVPIVAPVQHYWDSREKEIIDTAFSIAQAITGVPVEKISEVGGDNKRAIGVVAHARWLSLALMDAENVSHRTLLHAFPGRKSAMLSYWREKHRDAISVVRGVYDEEYVAKWEQAEKMQAGLLVVSEITLANSAVAKKVISLRAVQDAMLSIVAKNNPDARISSPFAIEHFLESIRMHAWGAMRPKNSISIDIEKVPMNSIRESLQKEKVSDFEIDLLLSLV